MAKSKSAFRTIAEAAEELGVAAYVLRFWETKFPQIDPMKTAGGRRYYRPDDIEVLKLIKNLLYEKRYTIEGAQQLIREKGLKNLIGGEEIQKDFFEIEEPAAETPAGDGLQCADELREAIDSLKDIRRRLAALK